MKDRKVRRTRRCSIEKKIIVFSLLCLVIFIANFSGDTFSRYATSGIGNSSIDIAKWDVSIDTTNQSNTLNILAGGTPQNYVIKVKSLSEVATIYDLELSNLPNGLEVSVDGGSPETPVNGIITFTKLGTFNINDGNTEHTHTITFNVPLSENIPNTSQINVNVRFIQKIT